MTKIKVFFLVPTDYSRRYLRRAQKDGGWTGEKHYCNERNEIESVQGRPVSGEINWPRNDGSWPKVCHACGRAFADDDYWFVDHDRIYRRADSGQETTLHDAPVGACWDGTWLPESYRGPDGRALIVRLPGNHDWIINSRASNCTLPDDHAHKCWVQHGRPEDGTLHVDKNGVTCAAGAGSIQTKTWHGFLRQGWLEP